MKKPPSEREILYQSKSEICFQFLIARIGQTKAEICHKYITTNITYEELGREYKLGKERIRQINAHGLRLLEYNKMAIHYPHLNYKDRELMRKYGITTDDKERMIKEQKNKCLICKCDLRKIKSVIDHDHQTGKVRGILCYKCNLVLGVIENNQAIITPSLAYLREKC